MNIAAASHVHMPPAATWRSGQQDQAATGTDKQAGQQGLNEEEQAKVEKLKARDREVRAHEQAHLAAAGGLAMSGATYSYERGPDGVQYATGGEVKIDTSPGSSPEETLRRARIIRAAAMAPAEPSGQDRSVAASASKMEAKARAELATQDTEKDQPANSQPNRPYSPLARFEPGQQLSIRA